MQINDFVAMQFRNDQKKYYAEITGFTRNGFEVRFVHSGSKYRFRQTRDFLEVVTSSGAFKPGTIVGEATLYSQDDGVARVAGSHVGVTFEDGRRYLGVIENVSPLTIKFLHSDNVYTFDAGQVARRKGGAYDGKKALSIRAYANRRRFLEGRRGVTLVLGIKDEFGNPLRGEFEVGIQRSNPMQEIYRNSALVAENSTAEDRFELQLPKPERLTLFVGFHPATAPFTISPDHSSTIDRQTALATTSTFELDANAREIRCDVLLSYDQQTVTASTKQEAVRTVFNQVTTNQSHSMSVKLEGEAAIELFGVGGKLTGGGTTTDTSGAGTIGGDTNSTIGGTGSSTTWAVRYPKGLQLNVQVHD
jgi:hypothetical protein